MVCAACGAVGTAWGLWRATRSSDVRRPNVVLICIDTLRADHLGCYGYARPTSPAIDALAGQGVRFDTVMAQSPWTLPSIASLLTGLYPHRNGVTTELHRLDPAVPTLAKILAENGYATGAVVNSAWLAPPRGFKQDFHYFAAIREGAYTTFAYRQSHGRLKDRSPPAPLITDLAVRWLANNTHRPFFLFIHYYDVHSDYQPTEAYRKRFIDTAYEGDIDGGTDQLLRINEKRLRIDEGDVAHLVNLYDGEIRQLDDQIARLLRLLEQDGYDQNTYVVLTSDHGEEFMEHGRVLHGRTMFEEVVAVPLIFRGPGLPAGVKVSALTQLVDVVPTLLGLLDAQTSATFDGVDLRSYWTHGRHAEGMRLAFAEADKRRETAGPDGLRMVRSSRFKLVYDRDLHVRRLYDLHEDPNETRRVTIERPDVTDRLMKALREFMRGGRPGVCIEAPAEGTGERLRGLGYL